MGRQGATLRINPKQFGNLQKPCMREMMSFLSCMSIAHGDNRRCSRPKSILSACLEAQSGNKKKPWSTINHHLLKLSRAKK